MSSFGFGNEAPGSWDTPPNDPASAYGDHRPAPAGEHDRGDPWSDLPRGAPARSGGLSAELWLGTGVVLTLVAIALHFATDSSTLAAIGWLVGGPLAIAVLGVFVSIDIRRRADPWHTSSGLADWGRRLLVVLALVAVTLNAERIADHLSRGHW